MKNYVFLGTTLNHAESKILISLSQQKKQVLNSDSSDCVQSDSESTELLKDYVDRGCEANPEEDGNNLEEAFLSISTAPSGALKEHYHEVYPVFL